MTPTPRDDRPPDRPVLETHLSDTEASGGKKRGAMRYVLGISLAAVIAIFAILLLLYR